MEYVKVIYPRTRTVFIDGEDNGTTNKILRVATGTYIFNLGEPTDYSPANVEKTIQDTNALEPAEINFQQKEA